MPKLRWKQPSFMEDEGKMEKAGPKISKKRSVHEQDK
jgi:hypothetical protein